MLFIVYRGDRCQTAREDARADGISITDHKG